MQPCCSRIFVGALATACTMFAFNASGSSPPVNPYLAAPVYAITHFDSSQSNTFPYAVPAVTVKISPYLPPLLPLPQLIAGPINIMTMASTSSEYMWGVSTTSVSYIHVGNGDFLPVATLPFPGAPPLLQSTVTAILQNPLNTVAAATQLLGLLPLNPSGGLNGVYTVVDNNNVLYANYNNAIYAFGFTPGLLPAVNLLRSLNTSTFLQSGEAVQGVAMTYDGNLVIVGTHSLSVVDRQFANPVQTVEFGSDESISNSVSVDQNNGIYVVSNQLMRKVVWTGTQLSQSASDGAWVSSYPTGDTYPSLFGSGSGTTPTLMGFGSDPDQLVVIADGLAHMSLVAFWRNQIPSGLSSRVAGTIPVTCGFTTLPTYIQTDNSVGVYNYGAFVGNTISANAKAGDVGLLDALEAGPIIAAPLGMQRFQWDPVNHVWQSVWARPDISAGNMVPVISTASNRVFVNGYNASGSQGWIVTGLDWATGQTVSQVTVGPSPVGIGVYSMLQFMPNGDLLLNNLLGVMRVTLPSGQVLPP